MVETKEREMTDSIKQENESIKSTRGRNEEKNINPKLTSRLQPIPQQIQRAKPEAQPHLDHQLGPPGQDPATTTTTTTSDNDVREELVQTRRDKGRRNDDQRGRGDVGGWVGGVFTETGGAEGVA